MFEVGKKVRVTDDLFKAFATLDSVMDGSTPPSFEGFVTHVAPDKEVFSALEQQFADAVENGIADENYLQNAVVYYDDLAKRYYVLDYQSLEVVG